MNYGSWSHFSVPALLCLLLFGMGGTILKYYEQRVAVQGYVTGLKENKACSSGHNLQHSPLNTNLNIYYKHHSQSKTDMCTGALPSLKYTVKIKADGIFYIFGILVLHQPSSPRLQMCRYRFDQLLIGAESGMPVTNYVNMLVINGRQEPDFITFW